MTPDPIDSPRALAAVVAMTLVSDAAVDARELEMLERLDAFARLGVSRQAFGALAEAFAAGFGDRLEGQSWLRLGDLQIVDGVLDRVRDPAKRLLVCRLAAGVITADGRVRTLERLIYDHMLMRWGLTHADVTRAIREAPAAP